MIAPPAISVPNDHTARLGPQPLQPPQELSGARFPHTRAQLTAIARQHRPLDNYDDDSDNDPNRVSTALVNKVASLLDAEREEDLKNLLTETFGPNIDDEELTSHVLDLMHRHRDDLDNIPFVYLTPTRRPISRPSSRASTHSSRVVARPDTPNSAPGSPLSIVFRRPHTPLVSPLGAGQQANSYITARSESPALSPVFPPAQFASSLPASPLSSPRILNAKAHEFKPIPRPLSAASSNPGSLAQLRAETPSPDMWAHNPSRPTSKLAIAAPLTPDSALLPRSGTPSSLRLSLRPDEDEDEEDPFDPFSQRPLPRSFLSSEVDQNVQPSWHHSPLSNSSLSASTDDARYNHYNDDPQLQSYGSQLLESLQDDSDLDAETNGTMADGMTPLDVLSMVFGSTLAPSELEEALANNGYDFDRAMSWLVDRQIATHHANNALPPPPRLHSAGGRVTVVSRDGYGHFRGGRAGFYNGPGFRGNRFNGRPSPGGNRVCRYFLAGECLRADCRFSHDLERALCRFWLRGTCAKGENCEFLHHLPKDIDVSGLSQAMSRTDLNANNGTQNSLNPPVEEFPALNHIANLPPKNKRGGHGPENGSQDPAHSRFAAAVKKPLPPAPSVTTSSSTAQGTKESVSVRPMTNTESAQNKVSVVAPKPSPRIKLRSPTLLPTLTTGDTVSQLYMAYRSRAHQLGAARNACLVRAADAWKKGDGAAAKRFSREGHDLNAKMSAEMAQAAGRLVRERARLAEQVVKTRDSMWSDDYGDRSAKGRICGAGLGVTLGIASQTVGDGKKLTPEERTEVMLDLHGLHSTEATEVVEEFLLALEREHFYGLAYLVVGEEKHTGTQDPARGASRARLAAGVREWLHLWGYPWSERDGVVCVDPLTHAS
ncbi:uncharacterized protein PHACADRAFT_152320 [Phanerochaete carnosa HHB-10118-sp]|uniref:C3H1-type domain-containing protein n=1 Tax=Phanerochaete carnosa (strain HHB-10118-sp) TaxID=650164 RepID=K5VGR4_PHACS|nr:uncharacterized protein PHACADRAFT_152320 [Phanerochaete carnosa HHB-10118-sp]EKM50388.1 hypothetical protein PHACADRAFT_152320 [Phanerochaete carnosa HHB-10118-sp]